MFRLASRGDRRNEPGQLSPDGVAYRECSPDVVSQWLAMHAEGVEPVTMRTPCSPGPSRLRARVAVVAAVLPLLAALPSGSATAAVSRTATGGSWISQVRWTSRPVAPGVTVRTGVSGSPAEQIHEAIINPKLARIEVTHRGIIARRQATSAVAAALGALVATNAGFFITSGSFGFQGVPDGLAVYGGRLESMNNGARAALIISGGRPRIADVEASVTVTRVRQSSYPVNGINRIPGIVQDCGRPGSQPAAQPRQDVTCTVRSELVLFTSQFGAVTPRGSGTQAVLSSHGTVLSAGRQAGGTVPAGGWVIQGVGAAGAWLTRYAVPGRHLSISGRISDSAGHAIGLTPGVSVGSAAPIVVSDGRVAIDAAAEGVTIPADPSFGHAWADEPQPRTSAGISASGDLILVTIDGRQPGYSLGVTLAGEASLMLSLGAVSAMNLDGGGSTAMAVQGKLVNRPSDGTERADGDFVVVLSPAR
jgi:exopolysaccharide biosynthesis protein